MIKSSKFIEYLKSYQSGTAFLEKMDNEGLNFYETPLASTADTLFQAWLEQILNEEGQDLVYWWLFEDVDKIITDNGKEINVEDIEEFTKYLLNNGYFETEGNS